MKIPFLNIYITATDYEGRYRAILHSAQKARKAAVSAGEAMGRRLADKQEALSIAETFLGELTAISAGLSIRSNGTLRRICRAAGETLDRMHSALDPEREPVSENAVSNPREEGVVA